MKLFIIFIFLYFIVNHTYSNIEKQDTLKLYYSINESEINLKNKIRIDSLFGKIVKQDIVNIIIWGYTDYLGTEEYNRNLSEKRAENVKKYIAEKGFISFVNLCHGKGKLKPEFGNDSVGIPQNRKVEIIVLYKIKENKTIKEDSLLIDDLNNYAEGDNIVLNNIIFYPGRHMIRKESISELDKLLKTLEQYPRLIIEIQGHICCDTSHKDGYDYDDNSNNLSLNRAKYVFNYLVDKGIDSKRMTYIGLGRTKPLIENEQSEEDKDKNRRVEIKIIKK